jgi:LAO/AO transport system kinase
VIDFLAEAKDFKNSGYKSLARAISLVENEKTGYMDWLANLSILDTPVIGVTGPPGAGKSSLINNLIEKLIADGKTVGVLAIDPTSPFNYGSILGDRIRMGAFFTNPNVYIRSLATRGSLGGLSAKTIEICDVMRAYGFDYIIVETVGVGQSEVDIVGLADTTVLVLVPEAGDEVQGIKSGIMEIANVFVVNKADRPGAEVFARNIRALVSHKPDSDYVPPVLLCSALKNKGNDELIRAISHHLATQEKDPFKQSYLLAERAYQLIANNRMKDVNKKELTVQIKKQFQQGNFNLYKFLEPYWSIL